MTTGSHLAGRPGSGKRLRSGDLPVDGLAGLELLQPCGERGGGHLVARVDDDHSGVERLILGSVCHARSLPSSVGPGVLLDLRHPAVAHPERTGNVAVAEPERPEIDDQLAPLAARSATRQEHLTGRLDAVFRAAERERSSRPDGILMTLRATESGP